MVLVSVLVVVVGGRKPSYHAPSDLLAACSEKWWVMMTMPQVNGELID